MEPGGKGNCERGARLSRIYFCLSARKIQKALSRILQACTLDLWRWLSLTCSQFCTRLRLAEDCCGREEPSRKEDVEYSVPGTGPGAVSNYIAVLHHAVTFGPERVTALGGRLSVGCWTRLVGCWTRLPATYCSGMLKHGLWRVHLHNAVEQTLVG